MNITERKQMEDRERRQMESMAHNARMTMLGEVASTLAFVKVTVSDSGPGLGG